MAIEGLQFIGNSSVAKYRFTMSCIIGIILCESSGKGILTTGGFIHTRNICNKIGISNDHVHFRIHVKMNSETSPKPK